jgi:protein TonB
VTAAVLVLLLWSAGSAIAEVAAPEVQEPLDPKAVIDFDTPPKPVKLTKPRYPGKAFLDGIEGEVILELLINVKGEVEKARVVRSVPGLDEPALECVRKWRFTPAIKGGKPVTTIVKAPVRFKIK